MLCDILSPGKSTVENLRRNVEKLVERVRWYCERRDNAGAWLTLNEDIRLESLEALLPEDLEHHTQMNRSRLVNYATLRAEIVLCVEARATSVKPLLSSKTDRTDDLMDTCSFGKGNGKGQKGSQGQGKGDGGA